MSWGRNKLLLLHGEVKEVASWALLDEHSLFSSVQLCLLIRLESIVGSAVGILRLLPLGVWLLLRFWEDLHFENRGSSQG